MDWSRFGANYLTRGDPRGGCSTAHHPMPTPQQRNRLATARFSPPSHVGIVMFDARAESLGG
jgi:hypothetical protein